MENLFDDIDDEILSNFPDSYTDERRSDHSEDVVVNAAKRNSNNSSGSASSCNDDYDSCDELIGELMRKERTSDTSNHFTDESVLKDKKEMKEEKEDEEEVQKAAEIATLEAKLASLKSELLSSTKKKKCEKKGVLPAEKQSVNKQNTSELCKHKKRYDQCFFCEQSNNINKECQGEVTKVTENLHKPMDTCHDSKIKKKTRVAHKPNDDTGISKSPKGKSFYSDKKEKQKKPESTAIVNKNLYTYGGISIGNPKISSVILEERMNGRKLVKISKISCTMKNKDIEGDWVTIAVIVKKCPPKKASSGKNFSVWQLSDLGMGTENHTVGFFLFGNTYTEHWKLQVGTVIGLLNPTIMKQEKNSTDLSLSLDNPKKLMEIGVAKELGVCKGIRKSDGRQCTMFINVRYGDYCEYHLQKAFKKARSGRMELQSGGAGPSQGSKGNRMKSIKKDISSGEVFYGGRTVTLSENQKNNVKVAAKKQGSGGGLRSFMGNNICNQADRDVRELKIKREREKVMLEGGSSEFIQLLEAPTVGTRNLIHLLSGNKEKEEKVNVPKIHTLSAKNFLKQSKDELLSTMSKEELIQHTSKRKRQDCSDNSKNKRMKEFSLNMDIEVVKRKQMLDNRKLQQTPKLARGFNKSGDIEFSDEEDEENHLSYDRYTGETMPEHTNSSDDRKKILAQDIQKNNKQVKESQASIRAKRKAFSVIQANGPITPDDPNNVFKKTKLSISKIEENLKKNESQASSCSEEKERKRKSLLSSFLGNLDLNSEKGKKILKQSSRNAGALRLAEAEREDKYFDSLERKERMEEKLTSIYEIQVTCYSCSQCEYMAESVSKLCKEEKHPYTQLKKCTKRFFVCKSCQCRCHAYNKPFPTKPCSNCGDTDYKRVAMATERKGPKIGAETLQLRGREQKFINSLN